MSSSERVFDAECFQVYMTCGPMDDSDLHEVETSTEEAWADDLEDRLLEKLEARPFHIQKRKSGQSAAYLLWKNCHRDLEKRTKITQVKRQDRMTSKIIADEFTDHTPPQPKGNKPPPGGPVLDFKKTYETEKYDDSYLKPCTFEHQPLRH